MRATATTTDEHHVTLRMELDAKDVNEAIDDTVKTMARSVTVKGFRKGKVPRPVLEAHVGGADVLRDEAVQKWIPNFYARAISETKIDPISEPQVELEGEASADEIVIAINVEVRPEVEISGQDQLRVTIPSPVVSDDEVEAQIQRILQVDAVLQEVDRPIITGDVLTMNCKSEITELGVKEGADEPYELEDMSYTVGSGSIAEGIDETIVGLRAGETLEAIGRRGRHFYRYDILIKKVCEQILPELTDQWVAENTSHPSVEALRDEIISQLRRRRLMEAKLAQRDAALMALSDLVPVDLVPDSLTEREVQHRLGDFNARLESQGLSFETYLSVTQQSSDAIIDVITDEAKRAVRVDLGLRALARSEGLEPDDDAIYAELELTAAELKTTPIELKRTLYENGHEPSFYWEIAKLNASKWLLENVTYVDDTGAELDQSLFEDATPAAKDAADDAERDE